MGCCVWGLLGAGPRVVPLGAGPGELGVAPLLLGVAPWLVLVLARRQRPEVAPLAPKGAQATAHSPE